MYAFIDETGNTGAALFDEAQPIFSTAALLTRTDFDAVHGNPIKKLGQSLGAAELHASELGVARIEEIARPLLKVLKKADPQFFIARVEKKYLLATKMFDLLFDPAKTGPPLRTSTTFARFVSRLRSSLLRSLPRRWRGIFGRR
jgi:hypothetical protein